MSWNKDTANNLPGKEGISQPEKLTRTYVSMLALTALFALACSGAMQNKIQTLYQYTSAINLAGRQRMLSRKLSQELMRWAAADTPSARDRYIGELNRISSDWGKMQTNLEHGNDKFNLPDCCNVASVCIHFQLADSVMYPILHDIERLKSLPPVDSNSASMRYQTAMGIGKQLDEYLPLMDSTVQQMVLYAQSEVKQSISLAWFLGGLMGIAMFFEGFLVFRPAVQTMGYLFRAKEEISALISQQNEELRAQSEELQAQTIELEQHAEENMAVQKLMEQERNFANAILDTADSLISVQDRNGYILRFNNACTELSGYSSLDLHGKPAWDILLPEEDREDVKQIFNNLAIKPQTGRHENRWVTKSGDIKHIEWSYSTLRSSDKEMDYIIAIGQDVTYKKLIEELLAEQMGTINEVNIQLESRSFELEQSNAKLEALATTDGLTGLKNHRAFQDKMQQECERAARYRSPFSIVLLDVDRFKQFNDIYGHPAGDEVLKRVGAILQAGRRSSDVVARYGGEEFAVILPETDMEAAILVTERFRRSIDETSWPQRSVTASFGVATWTPDMQERSELIAAADVALYASKSSGRNTVMHYNNINGNASNKAA